VAQIGDSALLARFRPSDRKLPVDELQLRVRHDCLGQCCRNHFSGHVMLPIATHPIPDAGKGAEYLPCSNHQLDHIRARALIHRVKRYKGQSRSNIKIEIGAFQEIEHLAGACPISKLDFPILLSSGCGKSEQAIDRVNGRRSGSVVGLMHSPMMVQRSPLINVGNGPSAVSPARLRPLLKKGHERKIGHATSPPARPEPPYSSPNR
jgi:hypothetical protein